MTCQRLQVAYLLVGYNDVLGQTVAKNKSVQKLA